MYARCSQQDGVFILEDTVVDTCAESVCCWDLWVMAADTDGDNYADESLCSRFVD